MLLIYLGGLVLIAAVSWVIAAPFFGIPETQAVVLPPVDDGWRKQKEEALTGIREAEFDYHLGKLSEADYVEIRGRLEARALEAIRSLEEDGRGDD